MPHEPSGAPYRGAPVEAVSRALRHCTTKTMEVYYARIRADDACAEIERVFERPVRTDAQLYMTETLTPFVTDAGVTSPDFDPRSLEASIRGDMKSADAWYRLLFEYRTNFVRYDNGTIETHTLVPVDEGMSIILNDA